MRLARFHGCALLVALATGWGCVHTVEVAVPAMPAVSVESTALAVVADARGCRGIADALVARLNATPGVSVDPGAPVRLQLSACGRSVATDVDVRVAAASPERRRVSLTGRAHALVTVLAEGQLQARVVGAARHREHGGWGDTALLRRRQGVDRELTRLLTEDLARQISPMPLHVERRVYPKATPGSARSLHSRAVAAEVAGDLDEAARLARLALVARPSDRTATYVSELDALLRQRDRVTPPLP